MCTKSFIYHTDTEAKIQNELISLSAESTYERLAHSAEIRNLTERMSHIEADFFKNFAVTNCDLHARIAEIQEAGLMSLALSTNHWHKVIDELDYANANLIAQHTRVEADLQSELINEVSKNSMKQLSLQCEIGDYEERMNSLEKSYFASFSLNNADFHGRLDQINEAYCTTLAVTTKDTWDRLDELGIASAKLVAHHTRVEADLQNELISQGVRSAMKEAVMQAEHDNMLERLGDIETSYFSGLATRVNDWHGRMESLEEGYFGSLALTTMNNHKRMQELEEMSLKQLSHHTTVEKDLQNELIDAVVGSTMKETSLKCEVENYEARVRVLEESFFSQFAVNNADMHSRLDDIANAHFMSLASTTNDSWKRLDELASMSYKLMEHHTGEELKLQDELIKSVAFGAMEKMLDKVATDEKLEESENRGMMTANEVEMRSDQIIQLKDRVRMMDLDLEGYMGRRRELRDRMHNVSSIVKNWKGKIKKAGSSLIKAQTERSRFSKVEPMAGGEMFAVGMGGNMNSVNMWGR
ncbi:hypothetical protein TrCOL_g12783 [Triparma columacea]|uniref:Uncharacterized protein n=2 Tax=Triparma columacea TaxID=722753 RepID=A0A9W7G9X8_9STRA|nr:hypothetical protein TrCOL_g12783 [Triparma columacea]